MTLLTPEFLQTKKYTAKRDRIALAHGGAVQPGVWDAGDLKPTWTSGMNIGLAAGFALVPANNAGNLGLYHVQNDAALTVTIPPAHASLPRLDQVYILVDDSTDGGASDDIPQPLVAQGTATSGATLDNRNGFAALPSNALRIADVLTPAAAAVLSAAAVRDRRPWARGATRLIAATSGSNLTVSNTTWVNLDSTNLYPRIELSGGPVEIRYGVRAIPDATGRIVRATVWIDGAVGSLPAQFRMPADVSWGASFEGPVIWAAPPAGSHQIGVAVSMATAGSATFQRTSGDHWISIAELAKPNGDNV